MCLLDLHVNVCRRKQIQDTILLLFDMVIKQINGTFTMMQCVIQPRRFRYQQNASTTNYWVHFKATFWYTKNAHSDAHLGAFFLTALSTLVFTKYRCQLPSSIVLFQIDCVRRASKSHAHIFHIRSDPLGQWEQQRRMLMHPEDIRIHWADACVTRFPSVIEVHEDWRKKHTTTHACRIPT